MWPKKIKIANPSSKKLLILSGAMFLLVLSLLLKNSLLIPGFLNPSLWSSEDPNIRFTKQNSTLTVSGASDQSEVTIKYTFPSPISINIKNLDAFIFRMKFNDPDTNNLKIRLLNHSQPDTYTEWDLNTEYDALGIDGTRLSEWQNYRLPIIWGKNINFNFTAITHLSITYSLPKPVSGKHLSIASPKLWSRLPLPWPLFYNDNRTKPITTSYLNRSQLPVFRLQIPASSLETLNSNYPLSLRNYVPAALTLPSGEQIAVNIKNRGDTPKHYAYLKRSWRISFPNNTDYQDLTKLNFIVPEEIFYGTIIPYQIAEKIGLPSPVTFPARLEINGIDFGAYSVVEQIDSSFITDRNRSKGLLYYGDSKLEEKYNPQHPLFESPLRWQLSEQINWAPTATTNPLNDLIKIISLPLPQFENQIESILDVENYLKWYVLYQLFNSTHNDEGHNIKMFYDANKKRFEMIPWDIVPNLNSNLNLVPARNFTNNRLTFKLFQVPAFTLKLDQLYYQYAKEIFTNPTFEENIKQITGKTKNDYLNDIFISPISKKHYEEDLNTWKTRIINRSQDIIFQIENPSYQICRLDSQNLLLSTSATLNSQSDNTLLPAKIIIRPIDNWLVKSGKMHREQLEYQPMQYKLPAGSTISNPVTEQVIYHPDMFLSLQKCPPL